MEEINQNEICTQPVPGFSGSDIRRSLLNFKTSIHSQKLAVGISQPKIVCGIMRLTNDHCDYCFSICYSFFYMLQTNINKIYLEVYVTKTKKLHTFGNFLIVENKALLQKNSFYIGDSYDKLGCCSMVQQAQCLVDCSAWSKSKANNTTSV